MPSAHDYNPATGLSREQYRDNWMSSGIDNIDDLRNWIAQNGGQVLSDNGTVATPYGDVLDIGTAFRTGNGTPGWTPVNTGMQQAQGSSFAPSNSAGMMNSSGMNFLPAILTALQNGFGAGMFGSQPQSAMPYNPQNESRQQPVSHYWSQRPMPTGQTDGTVIGSQFSYGPSGNTGFAGGYGPGQVNNGNNMQTGMQQSSSQPKLNTMTGSTLGGPTDYSQRNENFTSKPLPSNNLIGF